MDITKITDLKELKAIAYEQIKLLNQTQTNIQIVEQRISELEKEEKKK